MFFLLILARKHHQEKRQEKTLRGNLIITGDVTRAL